MNVQMNQPWRIVGQGLAGTCLGLEFLKRGVPFQIVDSGTGGSTRVAAGLINPLTGKNFQPSWLIEDFHPYAVDFFEKLGERFGVKLWHPMPVMRLAGSEKEWLKILTKLDLPEVRDWLDGERGVPTPEGFIHHVILRGGGWLDTRRFLDVTRSYFREQGVLEVGVETFDHADPSRILCEGAQGLMQDQLGSHRCAKGEILTVQAQWSEDFIRIGAGGWLIPIGKGLFRVGSTYEWSQLDELPTDAGRARITEIAMKLGGDDFEVVEHVAGIRPILRRSQPLIGKNAAGNWIFNGLGSKGSLYAPKMAAMLADWICDGVVPDADFVIESTKEFPH
ncbi:MAG: FAD-dependent oxidoreductase [Verrucomicrobiota bacterium]